jgi:hypothetical protein
MIPPISKPKLWLYLQCCQAMAKMKALELTTHTIGCFAEFSLAYTKKSHSFVSGVKEVAKLDHNECASNLTDR